MGFSSRSNCPIALSVHACSQSNTSGVLSCGHWPDTDRFVLDNTHHNSSMKFARPQRSPDALSAQCHSLTPYNLMCPLLVASCLTPSSAPFLARATQSLSSNVVNSLLTCGPPLVPCLPWTSPTPLHMSYFLKHMHDKRTPQAQCQFMPRVYAAGMGFLLTRSCGCGFSIYPQLWVRVSEGS